MTRFGGPAAGAAACALTAGLAADAGGFGAVTWDRALVAVLAAALVAAIVAPVAVPRAAAVTAGALLLLTAWTAASWLWSESPPRALVEAQRVALYAGVAAVAIVLRPSLRWTAAGVAGGASVVAVWNLVTLLHGTASATTGSGAEPVGYANSLALLCVVGLLLLPLLPPAAFALALPLGADLVVQRSSGAVGALAAGVLAYVFVARPRLRAVVAVVAAAGVAAAPFALRGHERTRYWHVAVAQARAHPVLGSGAGTFSNWWLRRRSVPLSTREAHSLYLETVAELGPLGLALLLASLGAPAAAALRRRLPAPAAAVVAYAAGAAVDFHWELAGVTAPVVLVAAAAVAGPGRTLPRYATVPAFATLTACAVLAYGGASRLDAAQSALRVGDAPQAVAEARSALRLAPFSADAWAVIGDAAHDAAAYRRALELDPNDWSLWSRLAAVTKGESRRRALREAARLNPLGASGP